MNEGPLSVALAPAALSMTADVELKIQDVVLAIQERADELFLRFLAFVRRHRPRSRRSASGRYTLYSPLLIGFECANDFRLHVPDEHERAWERLASEVEDDAVNVLRFRAGIRRGLGNAWPCASTVRGNTKAKSRKEDAPVILQRESFLCACAVAFTCHCSSPVVSE